MRSGFALPEVLALVAVVGVVAWVFAILYKERAQGETEKKSYDDLVAKLVTSTNVPPLLLDYRPVFHTSVTLQYGTNVPERVFTIPGVAERVIRQYAEEHHLTVVGWKLERAVTNGPALVIEYSGAEKSQ